MNVVDTINQSMTSAISLLRPIALLNSDRDLQGTYFEPEKGVAIAGLRRETANFGVMLVRAQYGPDNEVKVADNDYQRRSGLYHYLNDRYLDGHGLLGGYIADQNHREIVTDEVALKKIDAVRNKVEARFEVALSPNDIYRFLNKNKRAYGNNTIDKKINFQFTTGVPRGMVVGTIKLTNDGMPIVMMRVPTKGGGFKVAEAFVDKTSPIGIDRVRPGLPYLVRPKHFNKETGVKTVDVVRLYKRGVRMAVQKFDMGILVPGNPGYDVTPQANNGIEKSLVFDMPFMNGQDERMIAAAPMLTFDLDFIKGLMEMLSGYPYVIMKFKDSSSGVYFRANGNEILPTIEAIAGPTIQYVRGKVCLR